MQANMLYEPRDICFEECSNTSRQVGGALAVAVFGALLVQASSFMAGLRASLLLAAIASLVTAAISMGLQPILHAVDVR